MRTRPAPPEVQAAPIGPGRFLSSAVRCGYDRVRHAAATPAVARQPPGMVRPMPLPTSPMTQFRAPWHYALLRGRQRGLGTAVLVIMVLVCGLLDLASSGFSVWTVLGVCAPWFLLFIARAPWTTSVLVAVGAMYTLSDNQFSAMVLVGWLTVAILCRRGRFPQVVMVLVNQDRKSVV